MHHILWERVTCLSKTDTIFVMSSPKLIRNKYWIYLQIQIMVTGCWYRLSADGMDLGGSILMSGSHSPGGSTMTSSRNSSMPASRSPRSFAYKLCHETPAGAQSTQRQATVQLKSPKYYISMHTNTPHQTWAWRWHVRSHGMTWPFLWAPAE